MAQIKDSRHTDVQHNRKLKITPLTSFEKMLCFKKPMVCFLITTTTKFKRNSGVSSPLYTEKNNFYMKMTHARYKQTNLSALEIPIRKRDINS